MSKLLLLIAGLPGISLLALTLFVEGLPSPTILIIPGIIILLLLLLNGLAVAAEFAIISVRPTQIEEMIEAGNKRARGIMHILASRQRQDQYIATAQLGITVASLGLGMYGERQIAHPGGRKPAAEARLCLQVPNSAQRILELSGRIGGHAVPGGERPDEP